MTRIFFALLWGLLLNAAALADANVRAAQAKLKAGGFYFGEVNGTDSTETGGAISRFQIRNGLQITGQLDSGTMKALGLAILPTATATPSRAGEAWRHLRKSDQQFLEKLKKGEIPSPPPPSPPIAIDPAPQAAPSPLSTVSPASAPQPAAAAPAPAAAPMVTPRPENPPPPPRPTVEQATKPSPFNRERLRDYVAAFVLAGLDPQPGAELEFFAERVDYFGEGLVNREKIRQDLERYNKRWPDRRFWLDGELEITQREDGRLRVTFPLRYEVENGAENSSGKVLKTLVLEQANDADDFQIVAVSERKVR